MATRTRSPLKLKTYNEQLERFQSQLMEAYYRQLAGLDLQLGLPAIYAEHAGLFSRQAIDELRSLADAGDGRTDEPRELLRFAIGEYLAAAAAELTERVEAAESEAVIVWRGERIPYRQVWNRAADISNRTERNALVASYFEAVEAINPIREERQATMRAAAAELGFADIPEMVASTGGFDPDALAAEMRAFLADSETVYFAALRRNLAEIDIEQGDASAIDLAHVIRGAQWDRWFDAARMVWALRETLGGMGIDLDSQSCIMLDLEQRPRKSPRAFCAPVKMATDVRLVVQPRGGWDDYAALLHEAGHAEHFATVPADLPVTRSRLGDNSLTEGYGALFERLVGEPAWLRGVIGMPESDARAFADFSAFWYLHLLRVIAAHLIYELYLHRTDDVALARAQYAGMLSLTVGVRYDPAIYLAHVDDGLYVGRYIRSTMTEGSLSAWLRANHGEAWWTSPAAGAALRDLWSKGQPWDVRDVVAQLGYDRLDWRPVLRQIRTLLIGEMSGYGGPNITTRAGTRKV
ncbi:MAG TPA: hypothetical protein VFH90_04670 [Candidatus Limnocylindria bacterium]|nr:hypothetical protein [Candidatus Limnocylindria bacterium]